MSTPTRFFELVKFQHTIFALPFALIAMLLAAEGLPEAATFTWIVLAMVGARSAAMSFNRIVDARYDRLNPRTAERVIPRGAMSQSAAWFFLAISTAVFALAAYRLNRLCFALSPVALAVILGYSYTKRFTRYSHLILGLSLAIAPMGAWLGVTGTVGGRFWLSGLLGAVVMLWTAGFDVIYACLDVDFDRRAGLHSIPARLGVAKALAISTALHVATIALLVAFALAARLGLVSFIAVGLAAVLIVYEHRLVKPDDLSRVNVAFFTVNGLIGLVLLAFVALDLLVVAA